MKQLHNKIIFGLTILIVSIFTFVNMANARLIELRIDNMEGGGGGGGATTLGGGTTIPPVNTTPPDPLSISARLDNNVYSPGSPIVATVSASYSVCGNTTSRIKISGYIKSQGAATSKVIIENTVQGNTAVGKPETFYASNIPGQDSFMGNVKVYGPLSSPYIGIVNTDQIYSEEFKLYSGGYFEIEGITYEFKGTYFTDDTENVYTIEHFFKFNDIAGNPTLNYIYNGGGFIATYYATGIGNIVREANFEIPFNVVAPGAKSVTIEVYDNLGNPIGQDTNRNTYPAIEQAVPFKLRWEASGFNNDNIICTINDGAPEDRKKFWGWYEIPKDSPYIYTNTKYKVNCID